MLCGPPAGSNYLKPLLGPLAVILQSLQECSQLELALRVLVNSYGSCLQHVTSNVMDLKLAMQVWRQHIHYILMCIPIGTGMYHNINATHHSIYSAI